MAALEPVSQRRGGLLLSPEDIKSYEKNGYLVVKRVVPEHKLQQYNRRFKEICQMKIKIPTMTVMKDITLLNKEFGESAVNKIQDFYDDPVLFDYCRLPQNGFCNEMIRTQIVTIVGDLIGGRDLLAMHTMLINKPPDPGSKTSRHPMHQDLHYFPFRPADKICCAWTAMERVHRGNGCLVVIPGSHKTSPLFEHNYPEWQDGVNKMYHGIKGFDPKQNDMVYVEMEAGDTVFFHPLLVHGSGSNRTDGYRKGTSQENIANELNQLIRKKFGEGVQIDFRDVWRLRGRLVAGSRCNL